MGVIVLTDPVALTLADATLIANNNAAIKAAVNGGIDNNNFAAGKIFDNTKIMQGGATSGQALVWNGTSWVPGVSGPTTYRASGNPLANIVNTAALTDMLSQSLAAFSATGIVRFRLKGDYINNSGGNRGIQLKLILGGTTLIDVSEGSVSAPSAVRAQFKVSGEIQMADATHAHASMSFRLGGQAFVAPTDGISNGNGGDLCQSDFVTNGQKVVSDVTAAARTLQVQVAHSNALATLDCRIFDWVVEVL